MNKTELIIAAIVIVLLVSMLWKVAVFAAVVYGIYLVLNKYGFINIKFNTKDKK